MLRRRLSQKAILAAFLSQSIVYDTIPLLCAVVLDDFTPFTDANILFFFNLLFTFALLLLVLNFLAVEALAHIVIVVICFGVPGFNCNKRYLT